MKLNLKIGESDIPLLGLQILFNNHLETLMRTDLRDFDVKKFYLKGQTMLENLEFLVLLFKKNEHDSINSVANFKVPK